jgi:pimeloyl-ACP methyl ester carboxylesterase
MASTVNYMEITSPDGTRIGCHLSGTGPPLVIVHGTSGTHGSFDLVQPSLAESFTLIAIDRRGRDTSGDSLGPYAIEREFEDVAAVVDSVGEPTSLFGHSYGALVALGAAPLMRNLAKLVLYEAPLGVLNVSDLFLERLDDLAKQGDLEALLTEFYVDFVGLQSEQLSAELRMPDWETRVAAAAAISRELRAAQEWRPNPNAYHDFAAPTLMLLGSDSPEWAKRATEAATALIKHSRVIILQGQGHVATATAPKLIAAEIAAFLSDPMNPSRS